MIGNDSIDLSLKNIWRSWFEFRKGKRSSDELHTFQYYLEKNLFELCCDLNNERYRHGGYRKFIVCDNKRREISVASVRDRVVHRMIYDHLVNIYDKTFIYDAWSCRRGKGVHGAIERAHHSSQKHYQWVWQCDIKKFFDSVDQCVLQQIIARRIKDKTTLQLLEELILNYTSCPGRQIGMPIGNLTSQIFANIYLNELDRFVKQELKIKAYLRYGDDFIVFEHKSEKLPLLRAAIIEFLQTRLKLSVNAKMDRIIKITHGLKFLGVRLWQHGIVLNKRNSLRINQQLVTNNVSSYSGLVRRYGTVKQVKFFNWSVCEKVIDATA